MARYQTDFHLTASVNDFEAAYTYLTEDDMTYYLKQAMEWVNRNEIGDAVDHVEWKLTDEWGGYIELTTNRQLDAEELEVISQWVRGQNSDGLGEGFEQQDFANYRDDEYDTYFEDDEPYEEEWVMASFDWETNTYRFKEVV